MDYDLVLYFIGILFLIFWIWMIVDCAKRNFNNNKKLIWILIIIFTNTIGAGIYFFIVKKKMNRKTILSIFIASIMILSVLGISLNYTLEGSSQNKFKGYKFKVYNSQWLAYKNNEKILISSSPSSLENIQVPDISLENINTVQKVYLTTDPESQIPYSALLDIQNNLVPKLNSMVLACTKDSKLCATLPLKTCIDASPEVFIIQLQVSDVSNILFENNCLLIESPSESLAQYVDALILKLYGLE